MKLKLKSFYGFLWNIVVFFISELYVLFIFFMKTGIQIHFVSNTPISNNPIRSQRWNQIPPTFFLISVAPLFRYTSRYGKKDKGYFRFMETYFNTFLTLQQYLLWLKKRQVKKASISFLPWFTVEYSYMYYIYFRLLSTISCKCHLFFKSCNIST